MAASQSILGRAGIVLALVVFVFAATGPIVWLLLSSILQQRALTSIPPNLSPSSFTLANYLEVFSSAAQLGRAIINSLIVATFTTALAIILGAPAAYALARLHGGDLRIDSQKGQGTRVTVILPTVELPTDAEQQTPN